MNKAMLMGRLVADPEVRYTQGAEPIAIAKFRLAVDRRFKRDGEQDADFINVTAFDYLGEHVEKYYEKGMKVVVIGRIQTGSYVNKDDVTVYTTEVIAEELNFAESKSAHEAGKAARQENTKRSSTRGRGRKK